jgi:hypothetical protein
VNLALQASILAGRRLNPAAAVGEWQTESKWFAEPAVSDYSEMLRRALQSGDSLDASLAILRQHGATMIESIKAVWMRTLLTWAKQRGQSIVHQPGKTAARPTTPL